MTLREKIKLYNFFFFQLLSSTSDSFPSITSQETLSCPTGVLNHLPTTTIHCIHSERHATCLIRLDSPTYCQYLRAIPLHFWNNNQNIDISLSRLVTSYRCALARIFKEVRRALLSHASWPENPPLHDPSIHVHHLRF